MNFNDASVVYKIKRRNYFGDKQLRYGTLGFERVPKLYNRTATQWDLYPVHERLLSVVAYKKIKSPVEHFGINHLKEHLQKKEHYAFLCAQKYWQQQKKATVIKRFVSPLFNGVKSYLFQAGFLDGREGWQMAKTIFYYTRLKYKHLHQLTTTQAKREATLSSTNVFVGTHTTFSLKR